MSKKLLKSLVEAVVEASVSDKIAYGTDKKLRIFDFDDTLAITKSKIKVQKEDGTVLLLEPGEFAVYQKEPGDIFDYTDFQKLVSPEEIKWMTKILQRVVKKYGQDAAVILTARGARKPVEEFFDYFKLPKIPIVALDDAHPQAKAQWILYVIKKFGYNLIEFFDDSPRNIAAVEAIRAQAPNTKIITRLIKHKKQKA